jgi:hypothetical protein
MDETQIPRLRPSADHPSDEDLSLGTPERRRDLAQDDKVIRVSA